MQPSAGRFWHLLLLRGDISGFIVLEFMWRSRINTDDWWWGNYLLKQGRPQMNLRRILVRLFLAGSALYFSQSYSHFLMRMTLWRDVMWISNIHWLWLFTPVLRPTLNLVVHQPFTTVSIRRWVCVILPRVTSPSAIFGKLHSDSKLEESMENMQLANKLCVLRSVCIYVQFMCVYLYTFYA